MKKIKFQDEKTIKKWIERSCKVDALVRLPGDASIRVYRRVLSGTTSFVVMDTQPFVKEGKKLPFIETQNYLSSIGVDVPAIYDWNSKLGLILLEDLGDKTFLRELQDVSGAPEEEKKYKKAIDKLVELQMKSLKEKNHPNIRAYNTRFTKEKLMWEVRFAIRHFYEIYLKRKIAIKDKELMLSTFEGFCDILSSEPPVLTHRDFHGRNIMVLSDGEIKKERFVMIDFQDARLGPFQYDLASLLKDSYYQLSDDQIDGLLAYYLSKWKNSNLSHLKPKRFKKIFDLMAIQRNFKAIGSFSSFLNQRNDTMYLKFIGNTFENIRRTLLKYPEYSELREIMFYYYYF